MELKDTIDNMLSTDYTERFIAEYQQLKIRYEKLRRLTTKIEAHNRTVYAVNPLPTPKYNCPEDILREQQSVMGNYLRLLEVRAEIEGINLKLLETRAKTEGINL